MRGVIATGDVDPRELVERGAGASPPMEGADLVLGVTCDAPFDWTARAQPGRRVRAGAASAARAGR